MDSSYTEPDEPLKFLDGDEDIRKIIERDGEAFLAPIAVRLPGAHSSRERDFRLDNTKICHPITTRLADEFQYCYHVTEMAHMNGVIKEGLRRGGHRGGRTQAFLNPFAPLQDRFRWGVDPSWESARRPSLQRASTYWIQMHDQCLGAADD